MKRKIHGHVPTMGITPADLAARPSNRELRRRSRPEIPEGSALCPTCFTVVRLRINGKFRDHRIGPRGQQYPCLGGGTDPPEEGE